MNPIVYPVSLSSACSCHHCSHQARWLSLSKVSHLRAPEICGLQRIHDETNSHIQKGHHWKTATITLVFSKCNCWLVNKINFSSLSYVSAYQQEREWSGKPQPQLLPQTPNPFRKALMARFQITKCPQPLLQVAFNQIQILLPSLIC